MKCRTVSSGRYRGRGEYLAVGDEAEHLPVPAGGTGGYSWKKY